ncbi:autotransporter outer membrane beta-barrel domain-containing protein [Pantoea sp. PNT03]|nr:autotransporter outer membrane beta-barrel domain-containing protein [Pantoea sp. PNT03]
MNKNYRVIWNHSQGNYVVTSELARGKVKSSRSSTARRLTAGCVATAFMAVASVGIIQPALAASAYGEYASGAGNIIDIQDKDVATNDDNAHALFIEKGATAHSNNVNFTTSGKKAYGVYVNGAGSSIDVTGGTITTTGPQGYGLAAGNGGKLMASDITLNTSGVGVYADRSNILAKNLSVQANAYGVYGLGAGTELVIADSNVNVNGNGAYALLAENGGNVTSTNSHYTTSGSSVYGAWANKGSELTIIGGSITNTGKESIGIFAKSGGVVNVDGVTVVSTSQGINSYSSAVANVANSHVTVTDKGAYGLLAENGGKTTSIDSHYITTGDSAYGAWVNTGSELNIFGGSITTTGEAGYGMFAKSGGILNADNVKIDSRGTGIYSSNSLINANNIVIAASEEKRDAVKSTYNGIINLTNFIIGNTIARTAIFASEGGLINARSGQIKVSGTGAAAVKAYAKDSKITSEDLYIELENQATGVASFYESLNEVKNSRITSNQGGKAFWVHGAGTLNVSDTHINMSNENANDNTVTGINIDGYTKSHSHVSFKDSSFNLMGDKATGISVAIDKVDLDLINTTFTVNHGTVIRAMDYADFTVNLDHSALMGNTLIETGNPENADERILREVKLNAVNDSVLKGDINIDRNKVSSSSVSLSSGSALMGMIRGVHDVNIDNASWNMTGNSSVDNLNITNGTIAFTPDAKSFNTLTVNGDYHADNAKLVMNLALAGDDAASDKLHIAGNSSGTTKVQVHNAGGKGAATLEGIELIRVEGTQNGEFLQDGRIVAGAWDYALVQDKNGKWRLVSDPIPVDPTPVDPIIDPTPVDPIKDEGDDTGTVIAPEVPQPKRTPRARPEVGSYIANLAAASNLFTLSAADRPGVTEYRDALTGKVEKTTLWLRNEGAHGRFSDSTAQLKSITNSYMTQLGGDIAQWSLNGSDRFSLGVMAGYGNAKSNTLSKTTGYSAKGQVNGYSGGIYAGWQQDSQTRSGAFVDSWLAYNTFNNSVKGEGLGQESYKSKGMTASLEGGYSFAFGEQQQYRLQPKAQAVWMGVKTGDYTEQNGTRVSATGKNNVQTRAGVRATMHTATAQPYAEVNWLHNTQRFGSKLDGVKIEQAGARNIGEVKLGLEVNPSQHVGIWGGIAQQVGGKGFSDSSATLGVKVSF